MNYAEPTEKDLERLRDALHRLARELHTMPLQFINGKDWLHQPTMTWTAKKIETLLDAEPAAPAPADREIRSILKEVCDILGVKLGPGLATWIPLIAKVRELKARPATTGEGHSLGCSFVATGKCTCGPSQPEILPNSHT